MALRQATPTGRDGGEGLARLVARYTRTGYVVVLAVFVLLSVSSWSVLRDVKHDIQREARNAAQRAIVLAQQRLFVMHASLQTEAERMLAHGPMRQWLQHESGADDAPPQLQQRLARAARRLPSRALAVAGDNGRLAVGGNSAALLERILRAQPVPAAPDAGQTVWLLRRDRAVLLAVPLTTPEGEAMGSILLWPRIGDLPGTSADSERQASQAQTFIFDSKGGFFGPVDSWRDPERHDPGPVPAAARRLVQSLRAADSSEGPAQHILTYENEQRTAMLAAVAWEDELGMGVLRQVSEARALAAYYHIRNLVWLVFVVAIVLALLLLLLLVRFRRRVEHLSKISSLDPLTQLANRRRFDTELAQQWQIASRSKLPISLILIDVDCFKAYNDTYGHQAGDACLRSIAKTLAACVKRSQDLVVRYGGEEFAILLPMTTAQSARIIAEHIQRRIADLRIEHQSSTVAEVVTVSLGVATLQAQARTDASVLIERADELLYMAKERGRNRIVAPEPN